MSALAIEAIGLYRRHLSPRKGFRCAHHALHNRGSCSDFGLRVYGRLSFLEATVLMVRRLRDCRSAYVVMMGLAQTRTRSERSQRVHKRDARACDTLDAINCVPVPDAACADTGICDCLGGLF